MATSGERIHGPYAHGARFRIVYVDGDGRRSTLSFATEGDALRAIADAKAKLEGLQVSAAIEEYLDDCRARELRPSTIASTGYRLRTLLQVDVGRTGGPIAGLTPARAKHLVAALGEERSVAYRRGALAEAGTWARWCVARRYLRADPFAGLTIRGRAKRGKALLRIDEARRFASHCFAAAGRGDQAALAAVTCLYLGTRASEVTDRVVRDLDDAGRVLWIPVAKTEAGRRRVEIPAELVGLLLDRAAAAGGRGAPAAPLFTAEAGEQADRHWLRHHVARLCREARVPEVCTQSLRGLHATLARESGLSAAAVAAAIGQAGPAVTERSYIAPETTQRARSQAALRVLSGGRS